MKWFHFWLHLGDVDKPLTREVKFLNGALFILLALVFPYVGLFLFLQVYEPAIMLTVGGFVYLIALGLSKAKRYELSKYLLITNWLVFITYFAGALDNVLAVCVFFTLTIGLSYLLANSIKLPIYTLTFCVVAFLFASFQEMIPKFESNASVDFVVNIALYPTAFIFMFFIIQFFKSQIDGYIDRLEILNDELSESQEELTAQRDELYESNQKLEEFGYIVSHDLKGPLGNIQALLSMLSGKLEHSEDNQQVLNILDLASDQTAKTSKMVTEVFEYSKARDIDEVVKIFSIEELLADLNQGFSIRHGDAFRLSYSNLPTIESEPITLREVLYNIISNGLKYNSSEVKTIKVSYDPSKYELRITDNGIGIPKEQVQDVFVFFKRLENNKYGEGSGAGMALVKRIIDRQGIPIRIDSEVGKGTSVILNLERVVVD